MGGGIIVGSLLEFPQAEREMDNKIDMEIRYFFIEITLKDRIGRFYQEKIRDS